MVEVWISALLFGFVHPGSKWIMNQGVSLLPFCLLYIGIRLVIQLAISIKTGSYRVSSWGHLALLLVFGLIGAGLQVTEFLGISDGLPVSLVSFLVYSHPAWTLLLSRLINKEKFTPESLVRLSLAVLGVVLLTGLSGSSLGFAWTLYIGPLAAGLLIASWICLSGFASKAGISAKSMSLYYDLFSLMALAGFSLASDGGQSLAAALEFASAPSQFVQIALYSVLIGLLPNILFYGGSEKIPAFTAGLILLLEPVVSSAASWVIWKDELTWAFVLGASLILIANAPKVYIGRIAGVGTMASAILLAYNVSQAAAPRTLHLVEIVPAEASDYTVTQELKQIRAAAQMAAADYKKINAGCTFRLDFNVRHGTEEELYSTVKKISAMPGRPVVVGMSRTDFARLAAKAAQGSELQAISIGAAASRLKEINPNFVSIVSPWERQWAAISEELSQQGCDSTNTVAIYDRRSFLSSSFQSSFAGEKRGKVFEVSELPASSLGKVAERMKCVFVAINFSEAEKYLVTLLSARWSGVVFGVGDWNYFAPELKRRVARYPEASLTVSVPTGWSAEMNSKSRAFEKRIQAMSSQQASPVGAYTYDAVLLALDGLCHDRDLRVFRDSEIKKLPLVREYEGISDGGNYLSAIHIHRPKGSR